MSAPEHPSTVATPAAPLAAAFAAAIQGPNLDAAAQALERWRAAASPADAAALAHATELLRRTLLDYSVSEEKLLGLLRESIRDFRDAELEQWRAQGRLDVRTVGGHRRYLSSTRSNLFFRYDDITARNLDKRQSRWEVFLARHVEAALTQFDQPGDVVGDDYHFRLAHTIEVNADAVDPGRIIRAWVPLGQITEAQDDVILAGTEPAAVFVNGPAYPTRSVYMEAPAVPGQKTRFTVRSDVTARPRRVPIRTEHVLPFDPEVRPDVAPYRRQQPPHIVFSPDLVELGRSITRGAANDYERGRLLYEWCADNLRYSFAREYCTLPNIGQFVADHRYGDCGQITLFYMTLCRAMGIPARWQSGWVLYPELTNLHDWCELYIEPYGWVPVDVNYAVSATRRMDFLSPETQRMLREFYFGGLDAYRLVVNRDHGAPHYPPKLDWRSDDVDFQRGEVECDGQNLYYDKWSYHMEVEYRSGPSAQEKTEWVDESAHSSKHHRPGPGTAR